jgi:hypothetical protein
MTRREPCEVVWISDQGPQGLVACQRSTYFLSMSTLAAFKHTPCLPLPSVTAQTCGLDSVDGAVNAGCLDTCDDLQSMIDLVDCKSGVPDAPSISPYFCGFLRCEKHVKRQNKNNPRGEMQFTYRGYSIIRTHNVRTHRKMRCGR